MEPVGNLIIARVRGLPSEALLRECQDRVPNTRLAYLARLAFGDGDYRVFYSNIAAAIAWLSSSPV